jgi:hypothetical protein
LIEPPQSLVHQEEQARFISSEAVTEILDGIAPPNARGKELVKAATMSGCNEFQTFDCENASITRSTPTAFH